METLDPVAALKAIQTLATAAADSQDAAFLRHTLKEIIRLSGKGLPPLKVL